ncbi:putative DNA-binding domain-containing protein [Chitinibacter sp. SCUT-21]|uniref:HvfC/BufC family peptide modification chaperone n=1 Tax=Chitinibacter sp. SCUT-21 TaxID=2970891 RepID=UPI0035A570D0
MSYADAIAQFAHYLVDETASHEQLRYAERMRHYRANCRLNRIAALQATFSTVNQLVGDEFFRAMAREYVDDTPASSANLHAMGDDFAAFIAQFAPSESLPFLSDVARLDWARWLAHLADDVQALQISDLATLAEDDFGAYRLTPHPSLQLVQSSRWPLADILAMHQGGAAADLNTGGQQLLISRNQWQAISSGQWALLNALVQGATVNAALDAALMVEADTNVNQVLLWLFSQDLLLKADRSDAVCEDEPQS